MFLYYRILFFVSRKMRLYNRGFSGSLFRQMNEVYDYIDFRNQTHSNFEKLRRIDKKDYPETAVREALLNLLRQMVENGQIVQAGKGRNTQYHLPAKTRTYYA